jgi:hypothetical protein
MLNPEQSDQISLKRHENSMQQKSIFITGAGAAKLTPQRRGDGVNLGVNGHIF